ncbi:MAG: discoidin domain-containing protein [Pseudomonadota bacterium]
MPTARYWRILCRVAAGENQVGIQEVEMRATVGGADQTDSANAIQSTGSGDNAFDNTASSSWTVSNINAGDEEWVGQDFGSATTVEEIETVSVLSSAFSPDQITIQYSDNAVTWTDAGQYAVDWGAGETNTYAVDDTGGGGGGGDTAAFRVQHVPDDFVGASGGTRALTPVSSLSSAVGLLNNSRYVGAGDPSSAGNQNVNNSSLLVKMTDVDELTIGREATATGDQAFSASVWEYIGAAGGANEFIVRDRREITLNSADTTSFTPSGIGSADKLVSFITGIHSNLTGNSNYDHQTATTQIDRTTGEITVHARGAQGTATVHVVTVEFTGSNWTVHYGSQVSTSDSFTMTMSGSVADWSKAWIISQFSKNGGGNTAIADVTWTAEPGTGLNEVNFAHNASHDGSAGQRYTAFALENPDMTVTRFVSADSREGNVDTNITSAGLTDLEQALIDVSVHTSGGGRAHLRGVRSAHFADLTTAQHYCHRAGNNLRVALQIIDLPRDAADQGDIQASASITATSSAAVTAAKRAAASVNVGAQSSMSAVAKVIRRASASIAASSTATVVGSLVRAAAVSIAAQSALAADASAVLTAQSATAAQGAVAVVPSVTRRASTSFAATSSIDAAAFATRRAAVAVAGTSTLTAVGTVTSVNTASASIEAQSSMSATASATKAASALMSAASNMSVVATVSGAATASARVDAVSNLSAVATVTRRASANVTAVSSLQSQAARFVQASASIAAVSRMEAVSTGGGARNVSISATSSLSASSAAILRASASVSGASSLSANGALVAHATAQASSVAVLSVGEPGIVKSASATMVGTSTLQATPILIRVASVSIAAQSSVTVTAEVQSEPPLIEPTEALAGRPAAIPALTAQPSPRLTITALPADDVHLLASPAVAVALVAAPAHADLVGQP